MCKSWVVVLVSVLCLSGCATSLTMQTDARAYEPGEIQVVLGGQANLYGAPLQAAFKSAKSLEETFGKDSDEPISEEAFRNWLDAALITALFRPAFGPELMVRAGVSDSILHGLDVGLRTDFGYYKLDAKLQFWESEDERWAGSVMLGFAYHSGLVNSAIEILTMTEFSRQDLSLQVLIGWEPNDFVKINLAPHIMLSRIGTELKLPDFIKDRVPDSILAYSPNQFFQDEYMFYGGGNINTMVGYKYVYLAFDLGIFGVHFKPNVLGERRDYGGGAVSLATGLSFHYQF
jgi:hypothetical protein